MNIRAGMTSLLAAGVALVAGACDGNSVGPDPDPCYERAVALEIRQEGGVYFLAQVLDTEVVMSALFEGTVMGDEAGCLRLAGGDQSTVVWPKGYSAASRDGGTMILDPSGQAVGRVGSSFRLGGGNTPVLHDGLGFTVADHELAVGRCPGTFWIVDPSTVSGG